MSGPLLANAARQLQKATSILHESSFLNQEKVPKPQDSVRGAAVKLSWKRQRGNSGRWMIRLGDWITYLNRGCDLFLEWLCTTAPPRRRRSWASFKDLFKDCQETNLISQLSCHFLLTLRARWYSWSYSGDFSEQGRSSSTGVLACFGNDPTPFFTPGDRTPLTTHPLTFLLHTSLEEWRLRIKIWIDKSTNLENCQRAVDPPRSCRAANNYQTSHQPPSIKPPRTSPPRWDAFWRNLRTEPSRVLYTQRLFTEFNSNQSKLAQ